MPMELVCCEAILLREIADKQLKREHVALTYSLAIRSSERESVNWEKVNEAIVQRWSLTTLNWIKNRA